MQKLVAGLFAQLSTSTHEQHSSCEDLNRIIDGLRRQQTELEQRLSNQSDAVERRRLKTALEVARLQQKKALALRTKALQS